MSDGVDHTLVSNMGVDVIVNCAGVPVGLRQACSQIPVSQLRAFVEVHRANCRQPGCLVLAAMEARASEVAL